MYCYTPDQGNRIYRRLERIQSFDPLAGVWKDDILPEKYEQLSEEEVSEFMTALETARKAHKGQTDKAGKDYISHPVMVSSLTRGSFAAVTAALLHDVVEDTPLTLKDLKNLGMSERELACVDTMTHRPQEPRKDYIERIAKNYDAVCVKLADLSHNSDLSRIDHPAEKDYQRVERYREEYRYLSAIRQKMEEKGETE